LSENHPPSESDEQVDAPRASTDGEKTGRFLSWAAATSAGKKRRENQDAYLMFAWRDGQLDLLPNDGRFPLDGSDIILAVSDGMGGQNYGSRASRLALAKLGDIIPRGLMRRTNRDDSADPQGFLQQAVYEAHEAINHEARHYPECEGMGATLSMCWFTSTSVHIAHVGDSRIYLHASDRLRQISQDHSLVGQMQRRGELTEMQARNHPNRSRLSMAIGGGIQALEPQMLSASLAPGDLYLICSDGLLDGLWDKHLAAGLSKCSSGETTLEETRDKFMRESLIEGGRDNITMIAAQISDE